MSTINKIIASVQQLHGGDREQSSKRRSYVEWLARQQVSRRFPMPSVPHRESTGDK